METSAEPHTSPRRSFDAFHPRESGSRASLQLPRPPGAGTTCTLRPDGALSGCWCRGCCAALCAAKDWSRVWQTWLSRRLSSPTLLRCFEHASCFVLFSDLNSKPLKSFAICTSLTSCLITFLSHSLLCIRALGEEQCCTIIRACSFNRLAH
mgnify:CR=1 FL=1